MPPSNSSRGRNRCQLASQGVSITTRQPKYLTLLSSYLFLRVNGDCIITIPTSEYSNSKRGPRCSHTTLWLPRLPLWLPRESLLYSAQVCQTSRKSEKYTDEKKAANLCSAAGTVHQNNALDIHLDIGLAVFSITQCFSMFVTYVTPRAFFSSS
jgi:hypothetical protein